MYAGYSEEIEIKEEEKRFCDVVDGGLDRQDLGKNIDSVEKIETFIIDIEK